MSIISMLGNIVKGKVLVTTLIGAAFVGSAGVALAATSPGGQSFVHNMMGTHATVTPTHEADDTDKNANDPTPKASKENEHEDSNACPGHSEAQELATQFSLSTDPKGSSIQVICTLHDGTFKGTVNGNSVTTNHALGYGEIDQLLTYAQSLAKKDSTKLTDDNVLTYVATALKNCGSTAIAVCVNANVPANHSNDGNNDNEHDMNGGKPTVTPTPHAEGKPTSTPTPHTN